MTDRREGIPVKDTTRLLEQLIFEFQSRKDTVVKDVTFSDATLAGTVAASKDSDGRHFHFNTLLIEGPEILYAKSCFHTHFFSDANVIYRSETYIRKKLYLLLSTLLLDYLVFEQGP